LVSQAFVAAPPGTRIYTTGGNWHEIDSVEGTLVRTVGKTLDVTNWVGFCDRPSSKSQYDRKLADALWPLSPGKSAKYDKEREGRRWTVTFKAVGIEQVTVPLGTFSTWLIEAEEVGVSHKSRSITRCWYAPEVGFVVKRRHEIKEGSGSASAIEVLRIEKADRSRVVPFRAPLPGTSFDTNVGSYRIDGADGPHLFRKDDRPSYNTTWVGGFVAYASNDYALDARKRELAKLWPLEVGKGVQFEAPRPGGGVWVHTFKVERTETVTVPAGIYAAFVVTWNQRAINNPYNSTVTFWWSPALGFPIKRHEQSATSGSAERNYELRNATPPK
jgi:hypothetical protein